MTKEVETSLGTIITEDSHDPDFPGIYLSLMRNGLKIGLCLMEVDQYDPVRPMLKMHVWDPADPWDDPIYSKEVSAETVNRMFEEEEE